MSEQANQRLQINEDNHSRLSLSSTLSAGEESSSMLKQKEISMKLRQQFIVRPPTMKDLEPTVELFDEAAKHVIGVSDASLEDVRNEWSLPNFDLQKSTRIVIDPDFTGNGQMSERIIGYIEVWDIGTPPVDIWVWGRVHPDYEGLGIGTRLMKWAEKRSRQAIERVPEDLQVIMESGTYHHYSPAHNLFRSRNMEPTRHFLFMSIDLDQEIPAPTWPNGIRLRTLIGLEELRSVLYAVRDAFQDHWGYVDRPFEESYERWSHFVQNSEDFDPSLWFLAIDGEEIVGMSLCSPKANEDPDMGWVDTLGVRRPWRRQGVGLALLHHTFNEFQSRGKVRAGLGVDAYSLTGATRLYERAGMSAVPQRQFDTYRKVLRPGRDISRQEL